MDGTADEWIISQRREAMMGSRAQSRGSAAKRILQRQTASPSSTPTPNASAPQAPYANYI
jgi:hypothetical protein